MAVRWVSVFGFLIRLVIDHLSPEWRHQHMIIDFMANGKPRVNHKVSACGGLREWEARDVGIKYRPGPLDEALRLRGHTSGD